MARNSPPAKFGHLELTFPRGALTKQMCADIDSFWCGVFEWSSYDVDYPQYDNLFQHRLSADGQTIVLAEADEAMALPTQAVGQGPGETVAVPHLGLELASVEEVERVLGGCLRFQETDPRVKVWDAGENRFEGHHGLHRGFLVSFLIPIWFDVYATRWDPGFEPQQGWRYFDAASPGV